MRRREVIRLIRSAVRTGRIYITGHAKDNDDSIAEEDMEYGLLTAESFHYQPENGRWKVRGVDRLGNPLTIIVLMDENRVIVWTAF